MSLSKSGTSTSQVGISVDEERVAVAVANHANQPPTITHITTVPVEKSISKSLQSALKTVSANGAEAVFALKVTDTRFHKVQKPSVPVEERDSSLLFLMKDRLSQPVDKTLIGCIDYPEGCRHDDQLMVFEVSKPHITALVEAAHDNGLNIAAIDASELLYGDLIFSEEDMHKGIGILVEHDRGVHLLLYRDHSLYLIRKLQDIVDLMSCLPAPGNAQMADMLMLEVQRTLDYYDSLMGQPAPANLYLVPSFTDLSPLAEYLDTSLAPSVSMLDLNALYDLPQALDYATQQDVVSAVAASLRRSHQ